MTTGVRRGHGRVPSGVLVALALAAASCGAQDIDAPVTTSTDRCPSVDAMLPGVRGLIDAGALGAIEQVLSADLSDAARADLVRTILDLVRSLPDRSLADFAMAGEGLDADGRLQAFAARLSRWVAEEGPHAPYPAALAGIRRLFAACDGPPTLALFRELLRDEALLCALRDLPAAVDLEGLLATVEVDGETGPPAFRALVRNLLLAATSPDFTVEAWLDLVGIVTDLEAPPIGPVVATVRRLLDDPSSRAAIAGLSACVLQADPPLGIADLAFDLVTDDTLDLAGSLDLLDPSLGPILFPELLGLLDDTLGFLAADAAARSSLAALLSALLAPTRGAAVLADVARLLDARVIGEIVDTISALATRSCTP